MSMTPYSDAARDINARCAAIVAKRDSYVAWVQIATAAALGIMTGISLPMAKPAASYDLVQFHGLESDIVDSGLSLDDCTIIIPTMRAAGDNVTCETASN